VATPDVPTDIASPFDVTSPSPGESPTGNHEVLSADQINSGPGILETIIGRVVGLFLNSQ
jgi:hypothetical protein